MSRSTKKKHVVKEILSDNYQIPTEKQSIVRIINSRGNNLHEVEGADAATFLVSMPTKFRKNIWVKRGDFVIVEAIDEGDKVKAEIVNILTSPHIKFLKSNKYWPVEFEEVEKNSEEDIFVNTNRRGHTETLSSESD